MTTQLLFIHSAGSQGPDEGSSGLSAYLQEELGTVYELRSPLMPDPEPPEYAAWNEQIGEEIAQIDDAVVLIGHSLGGAVLLKHLSDTTINTYISGLFLVAPPLWGAVDWEVDEFVLPDECAAALPHETPLCFYHSRDDDIVPFAHLGMYAEKFPQATVRELDGHGHLFADGLPELVQDIKNLQ